MAAKELLTVIIPCLNEERNLRDAVAAVERVAPELDVEVRILVIDDGSTDRTGAIAQELADEGRCQAMLNRQNLGLGRSVLNAYSLIEAGSWVSVLPGDNELVFDSLKSHLAVRHDADVVLGYLQNPVIRPAGRRLASFAFTQTTAALYGFSFRYLNGLKLYRLEAFQGIEVVASGHAFAAELLAKAMLRNPNLRIVEAPFVARGRATGQSKAIRPSSVVQAMRESYRGWRSVAAYRERVVRRD